MEGLRYVSQLSQPFYHLSCAFFPHCVLLHDFFLKSIIIKILLKIHKISREKQSLRLNMQSDITLEDAELFSDW